jgi:hypothetical protein
LTDCDLGALSATGQLNGASHQCRKIAAVRFAKRGGGGDAALYADDLERDLQNAQLTAFRIYGVRGDYRGLRRRKCNFSIFEDVYSVIVSNEVSRSLPLV